MTRDAAEPEREHPLVGGNVSGAIVRVGDTVRKPAGPWTPAVEALLGHLHAAGFGGAPRSLGLDGAGRQVLEYVPGPMAHDLPPLDAAGLYRVGEQPWARLFAEGRGDYWGPAADYIERHLDTWRRALR